MNKGELTKVVHQRLRKWQASKALSTEAVDAVFAAIRDSLSRGNNVTIVGFGTFLPSERKARDGHNPRTGQKIRIAATVSVRFRPGAALKRLVGGARQTGAGRRR